MEKYINNIQQIYIHLGILTGSRKAAANLIISHLALLTLSEAVSH